MISLLTAFIVTTLFWIAVSVLLAVDVLLSLFDRGWARGRPIFLKMLAAVIFVQWLQAYPLLRILAIRHLVLG